MAKENGVRNPTSASVPCSILNYTTFDSIMPNVPSSATVGLRHSLHQVTTIYCLLAHGLSVSAELQVTTSLPCMPSHSHLSSDSQGSYRSPLTSRCRGQEPKIHLPFLKERENLAISPPPCTGSLPSWLPGLPFIGYWRCVREVAE